MSKYTKSPNYRAARDGFGEIKKKSFLNRAYLNTTNPPNKPDKQTDHFPALLAVSLPVIPVLFLAGLINCSTGQGDSAVLYQATTQVLVITFPAISTNTPVITFNPAHNAETYSMQGRWEAVVSR